MRSERGINAQGKHYKEGGKHSSCCKTYVGQWRFEIGNDALPFSNTHNPNIALEI